MSVPLLKRACDALESMAAEFRALDLPYGSKAYTRAMAVLNAAMENAPAVDDTAMLNWLELNPAVSITEEEGQWFCGELPCSSLRDAIRLAAAQRGGK